MGVHFIKRSQNTPNTVWSGSYGHFRHYSIAIFSNGDRAIAIIGIQFLTLTHWIFCHSPVVGEEENHPSLKV
jgi:hypothetical protein